MRSRLHYRRESRGVEFERVIFFTDAVFAIALTLLVVEVGVPETVRGAADDPGALLEALGDKVPLLAAFFLGCFVIGSYWAAHHRFMATLDAVDRGFIGLTVVYLAFVALLPFPTGVLGEFSSNPISMVAFALNMAAVSSIEAVMLVHARRRDLLRDQLSDDVYSWVLRMELSPVALFLVSMPVAFVAPWLAVVVWSLSVPLQAIWNRRQPGTASQYLS